tara:strand:- start:507 stop:791 length:285 start_codon:yes stop_codon:yes gene_type:complete
MTTKDKIFEQNKMFKIKYTLPSQYQFQENEEKGEFIDKNNNVAAQLWDKDSNPHGFIVAALFMGEINFKLIYYNRITILEEEKNMPNLVLEALG